MSVCVSMCLKAMCLHVDKKEFWMIHKKLLTTITPRKYEGEGLKVKKEETNIFHFVNFCSLNIFNEVHIYFSF